MKKKCGKRNQSGNDAVEQKERINRRCGYSYSTPIFYFTLKNYSTIYEVMLSDEFDMRQQHFILLKKLYK